jgi:hypothetical protein
MKKFGHRLFNPTTSEAKLTSGYWLTALPGRKIKKSKWHWASRRQRFKNQHRSYSSSLPARRRRSRKQLTFSGITECAARRMKDFSENTESSTTKHAKDIYFRVFRGRILK